MPALGSLALFQSSLVCRWAYAQYLGENKGFLVMNIVGTCTLSAGGTFPELQFLAVLSRNDAHNAHPGLRSCCAFSTYNPLQCNSSTPSKYLVSAWFWVLSRISEYDSRHGCKHACMQICGVAVQEEARVCFDSGVLSFGIFQSKGLRLSDSHLQVRV